MLTTLLTIITDQNDVAALTGGTAGYALQRYYAARPGDGMTILYKSGDDHILAGTATWTGNINDPKQTFVPFERALKEKKNAIRLHNNRCAIPVNCFFCEHDGRIMLIRLINHRVFWIGGFQLDDARFVILSVEVADILLPVTPRMPLLMSTAMVKEWLCREHVRDILEIADSSGDHWFDYYEVDRKILLDEVRNADYLKPISLSFREQEAKQELLDNLDFTDERFNRNNTKGR